MMKNNNNLIIYQDDNGLIKVNVRFADEDVWLTQGQLAEIYDTTQYRPTYQECLCRQRIGRRGDSQEILVSSTRRQSQCPAQYRPLQS